MSKTLTANLFHESFTVKLDMIRGEPTYQKLVELQDCIYANASQIPTPLGGGHYGYLGALIPAAEYITLPHTITFVIPMDPGNIMAMGHAGTAHEIADAVRAHAEELRQYNEHDSLMQALQKQIIESVEENYISVRKLWKTQDILSSEPNPGWSCLFWCLKKDQPTVTPNHERF
jgi:hypothetical protein